MMVDQALGLNMMCEGKGQELTFAGVTVLRFGNQGQVVDHRDYDNHIERRERPYADW